MEIGFEFTAAKPKGLRAADDAPIQQPMKRDVKISRNPSTDQKKVRRAQQRKVAAKTICRGCHTDMLAPEGEKFPMCNNCSGVAVARHLQDDHGVQPWGGSVSGDFSSHNNDQLHEHAHSKGADHKHGAKTATQTDVRADRLNPGDHVRTPTGQVVKVHRVRHHQTSGDHVYVDTDAGTTMTRRSDSFTIVPHNSAQQELPGFGTPGGNFNDLPGTTKLPHGGADGRTNQAPQNATCPLCTTKLHRQGDHYVCPRDGFTESVNNVDGKTFYGDPSTISHPKGRAASRDGLHSKDAAVTDTKNPVSGIAEKSSVTKDAATADAGQVCKVCGTDNGATDDDRCEFCGSAFNIIAPPRPRTSALNDSPDCRLCGGDLLHKSNEGGTTKAECRSCGTEHTLQQSRVAARTESTWVVSEAPVPAKYQTPMKNAIARRAHEVLATEENS